MNNQERFQWIEEEKCFQYRFQTNTFHNIIFEYENKRYYLCISINQKNQMYWEPYVPFEKLPYWFQHIYKEIEKQIEERDAIRRLI